jgi:hypothetical protein
MYLLVKNEITHFKVVSLYLRYGGVTRNYWGKIRSPEILAKKIGSHLKNFEHRCHRGFTV